MQNPNGQASWHMAHRPPAAGHLRTREHWLQWAETLHRYQLDGIASWFLDAGRPLALLSAQLLYFGRPFFGQGVEPLARLLESDDEARAFASFLDGESFS